MARNKNGFGNPKSFMFKTNNNRIDVGLREEHAGVYPRNRRLDHTVKRTVIEQEDKTSNWVKWRKGYEYYNVKHSWCVY